MTTLCLVGWTLVLVAVARLAARWRAFEDAGLGVAVGGAVALAVTVVVLLGYWRLRRWGLWLVLVGLGLRVAVSAAGGPPLRPANLAWPGVLLLAGLVYYRRLT